MGSAHIFASLSVASGEMRICDSVSGLDCRKCRTWNECVPVLVVEQRQNSGQRFQSLRLQQTLGGVCHYRRRGYLRTYF